MYLARSFKIFGRRLLPFFRASSNQHPNQTLGQTGAATFSITAVLDADRRGLGSTRKTDARRAAHRKSSELVKAVCTSATQATPEEFLATVSTVSSFSLFVRRLWGVETRTEPEGARPGLRRDRVEGENSCEELRRKQKLSGEDFVVFPA